MTMPMNTPRITDSERAAGKRADYHVYYRRNGKLRLDPIWNVDGDADTAEKAAEKMAAFARELRWRIEIVRVEAIDNTINRICGF